MRKALALTLLLATGVTSHAEVTLVADGRVVAHGLRETSSPMPPSLVNALGGRQVATESLSSAAPALKPLRKAAASVPSATIGPLLNSVRGQEEPYNWMCPRWTYAAGNESQENCLSGCVATCIEQIMAYYRYPEALVDTLHGWQTANYTIPDMLPGTRFDWDNYLPDYRQGYTQEQGEAIALTSLAAGMAVHMNYGLSSSGASIWAAEAPLRRAFGYGTTRLYDRVFYSPSRWHAILQNELREGRPVAYTAHTMSLDGHAFNIDGVDTQGYYHVNWGYDGHYDGWYDLDWLDPWEPIKPQDDFISAFFCNHSIFVMHPSPDVQPLEPDTFRLDSLGVKLHSITLLRQPDTHNYIPADFDFENTSSDTITYTYEVMSFLPTDTAVFYQADYVGLAAVDLLPGERRTQRLYLLFEAEGERLLGISHDDETIPYTCNINVARGEAGELEWGEASVATEGNAATFTIPVANTSASGTAGELVTYCLLRDDRHENSRHYTVLTLPAGEQTTLSVRYDDLEPDVHYTFWLRCPWTVKAEVSFVIPGDGIQAPRQTAQDAEAASDIAPWFDLSGRRTDAQSPGPSPRILVTRGRKVVVP